MHAFCKGVPREYKKLGWSYGKKGRHLFCRSVTGRWIGARRIRPVLVIQNDLGNHFSPTVIIAAITAKMAKPKLPTHIGISATCTGIGKDSVILMEQIRTIDKSRLKEKVCHLDESIMCVKSMRH